VDYPPDLVAAATDPEIDRILSGEKRLFSLRREAHLGQKAQLRERVSQLDEQIQGLIDQAEAKKREIELVNKELVGVRELWEKNLVQLNRVIALERDAARLEGERGQLVATSAQTKGKISETELQIIQLDQTMRSEVAKELSDIRAKMSELVEKKVTAADQLARVELRAPQTGVVHQLSVHTEGGVISAGEQIMLIVPESDALLVEVRIAPEQIDRIQLDQPALLRFPSFNQRTTPELNGKVTMIAADVNRDDRTGKTFFIVRMTLNPGEQERLAGQRLVPGMPVEAFIRTDERTILSYLFKPLADQAQRAFRE
jgi:HlyD family secretion protein